MSTVREKIRAGGYANPMAWEFKPIPVTDDMTIAGAREHKERERTRRTAHRKTYNEAEAECMRVFRADLEAEHGMADHPKADRLYELAWEHGHSGGLEEVVNFYEEFVDLCER